MRRILLFLVTNFAVILVLGIVASLLGVNRFLTPSGLDLKALLIFSFIFGMGGSLISLQISRWSAKRLTRCKVITGRSGSETETWLYSTVERLTRQADLPMPEVAIYSSSSPNAFATGPSKRRSLVAVSTGLMDNMNQDEVEAVLAHEVSHIRNGDMVSLALIQGVVNTFVFFFARVVGYGIDAALSKGRQSRGPGIGYYVGTIAAQILFSILASMIVFWFSRKREFRADHGAAQLSGAEKMVSALQALQRGVSQPLPGSMAAFGISGKKGTGLSRLFMTHPPLEERIAALQGSGARPE